MAYVGQIITQFAFSLFTVSPESFAHGSFLSFFSESSDVFQANGFAFWLTYSGCMGLNIGMCNNRSLANQT